MGENSVADDCVLRMRPYKDFDGPYKPGIITRMIAKVHPVKDEQYIFQRQIGARNTGILEFGIDFEKRAMEYGPLFYPPYKKTPSNKKSSTEKAPEAAAVQQEIVQEQATPVYTPMVSLIDAMYKMNQDNQAAETSRHKEIIESMTKTLYQTNQGYERMVHGLSQELSKTRSDYAEMQSQYQHLLKEMGNQVAGVIKAYEQEHARERGFLMEVLAGQRRDYESMLDRTNKVLNSYVEEQSRTDERTTAAIMEMNQRNMNTLTDAIEKMVGYKQKAEPSKKRAASKKGGRRPGIGTISSQMEELIRISKQGLEYQKSSLETEKRMAIAVENSKNSFEEYADVMSSSN